MEFAKIVDCPYNKRFSTNGWGDFKIDKNGLYSYEDKCYSDDSCWGAVEIFLHGEIIAEINTEDYEEQVNDDYMAHTDIRD